LGALQPIVEHVSPNRDLPPTDRQLLDAFLDNIPERLYFKDPDGRFLRASARHAEALGCDCTARLVGLTEPEACPGEAAGAGHEEDRRIARTGEPIIDREERRPAQVTDSRSQPDPRGGQTRRDGDSIWLSTTKLPLRDQRGRVIGMFAISRDITQRKRAEALLSESEERWRALLAHLQEIVVLVDDAGVISYATPSVQRWLGHSPDGIVGRALAAVCHPDDREALLSAIATVSADRSVSLTARIRHADGSWHTLEARLVSLRHDPAVRAVLVAASDVTDRALLEAERERLEMERRVSHRLEAVGQLAAGIAHEINTPLQFVGDSVTFLNEAVEELLRLTARYRELLWLDTPLSVDERREIMVRAEENADVDYLCERIPQAFARTVDGVERVRSIVQAMKRFSHAAGEEAAPADLNEALQTTLAVCRNEYKYVADVELDTRPLPPVTCNIGELNQVFLNLIINAAQAIESQRRGEGDGRGTIRIRTRCESAVVVVTVADDGPGIPPEIQDRIYEPFFTTKPVGKGTGQGLALARTTVERHGGTLECRSAPGAGAAFTIRLPLDHGSQRSPIA